MTYERSDGNERRVSDLAADHAEASAALYPEILRRVRLGDDLLQIADELTSQSEIDRTTLYRWVHHVDSVYQKRRRSVARIGALFVWISGLSFLGFGGVLVFGTEASVGSVPVENLLIALALLALPPALYLSLRAGELAMRRRSPFE